MLTNGDTITGVVVEEDKQSVVLRSTLLGEITIPRASIASGVAPHKPVKATAQATPPPAPAKPPVSTVAVAVAAQPKATKPPPPAQGVKPAAKPWRTKVEFGFNYEDGKNQTTRYNILAQSEKNIGRNNLRFNGRVSYANQNNKATADRSEAGFRWRQNYDNRVFMQTQTSYYRDLIADIDINIDQNLGVGYGLFDTNRFDFNFGIGLTGQYREAIDLQDNIGALAEFFQDQTIKLTNNAKIVQSLNIQYWPTSPLVATTARNEENLKWKFSTTLVGKLSESISLNLRFEYNYDNAIVNPSARTTQRVTSSLGYLF